MSFDLLAPAYLTLEQVVAGPLLQKARLAHLPNLRQPHRALLLGEGPGRFLVELLKRHPEVDCTCVEKSRRMVTEARNALTRYGFSADRVRFLEIDASHHHCLGEPFDLIATHFFLDCFTPPELELLVKSIATSAGPNAVWLISDFRIPDAGWRRFRARLIHRIMYMVFRQITGISASHVCPPDSFLSRAGFQLQKRLEFNHGLIHSDVWCRLPSGLQ